MVGTEKLQDRIERSRLRWYGHVKRMDEQRIPKKMFELEIDSVRPVGRPKKRWKNCVNQQDQHEKNLSGIEVGK
ncbi:hypothetical protein WDU94_005759 [Cyamophila willieti]